MSTKSLSKLCKQKAHGKEAVNSKKYKRISKDLLCLPQELKGIPKGSQQRQLLRALGLNFKSARLISALPPNSLCAKEVYTLWDKLRLSKGVRQATKVLKELYTELIRYSCGLPIVPSTSTWLKRDGDNFPLALRSLKRSLREGTSVERRITLGFVRTFESITFEPEVKVSTIVEASKGPERYREQMHDDFSTFLNFSPFGKMLKKEYKAALQKQTVTGLIFSTKKSPYFAPTSGSVIHQLGIVKEKGYLPILERWSNYFNRSDYNSILSQIAKDKDLFESKDTHREVGRLAFLKAPGCKTRVVAIVNYWFQDALYPLHKVLYSLLRRLKSDGTFDQTAQAERVRLASLRGPVWSFDLTAATDRLPLGPQVAMMIALDHRMGTLWSKTLSILKFYVKETNSVISYRVGQPMGIYSSWASLALAHHCIIQFAAWKLGFPSFQDYAVLGDDVAIWNEAVANEYLRIMKLLDVGISSLKSFVPEKKGIVVAEFAKRIFHNGVHLTPIPTLFQTAAWHDYTHWPTALEWLGLNGFTLDHAALDTIRTLAPITHRSDFSNFVCLLHVWNLLHAPILREEVAKWLPEGFEEFSIDDVARERLEILCDKLNRMSYLDPVYLRSLGIEQTPPAEEPVCQAAGVSEPYYFQVMRLERLKQFNELKSRFSRATQSKTTQDLYGLNFNLAPIDPYGSFGLSSGFSSSLLNPKEEEQPVEDDLTRFIHGLEYLPYPSYENMKNSLVANEDHWKLANKYFYLITRRLKAKVP